MKTGPMIAAAPSKNHKRNFRRSCVFFSQMVCMRTVMQKTTHSAIIFGRNKNTVPKEKPQMKSRSLLIFLYRK